jgi:uncharacterized protein (TIGR03435 family)
MSRMRHVICNVVLVVAAIAAAVVPLPAQAPPAQKPQFEVASVKPNNSGSGSSGNSIDSKSGYLRAANVSLRALITQAYRLFDFQVVGGPDWINTAKFDIQARAETGTVPPPTATAETSNRNDLMLLMIQSLLEDRFQLKVHHETRDLPVFALTVAKGGPKLEPTVQGHPGPGSLSPGSSRTNGGAAGVEMSGSGISVARLIALLAPQVGRPIIDKTNLTSQYDFTLKWSPSPRPTALGPDGPTASSDPSGPSIFTALQEQLGLRLDSAREPVQVLVIDSVQKPSEN